MASNDNFAAGLKSEAKSLLNMTSASGIVWNLEGELVKYGETPEDEEIEQLINWIRSSSEGTKNMFHTHCLSSVAHQFDSIKKSASGIFFLNISPAGDQYILWFRREKIVISLQDSKDNEKFSPQYFDKIFKRGYSESWNKGDINNAVKLKNSITNYIIQSSERLKKHNEQLEKLIEERTQSLQMEIKKRKKAEEKMSESLEELKRSNYELENFAYVASHDLQEPLRKIQAFSGRLKKVLNNDELDKRASDYFNRLTNAAERMQKLINDLLSYSRVTTHAKPFAEVDMDALLNGVLSDLQVKISERKAVVTLDKIGKIDGDKHQLHRLFQNLIQNALKFHKKNVPPVVKIINQSRDDLCIISVKDNGIGFENNYAYKIFELFERLHGRSDYEGTGLGLAICKKIVERHHGHITTKSKPGEGAEFIISLPYRHG